MRYIVIFLLNSFLITLSSSAQQAYNSCFNALELCPNAIYSVDNIQANATICPGCEDDATFCFDLQNSIWFTFLTNDTGGDVQVDFSNLQFETNPGQDNELQATIIEVSTPCNPATYNPIGNCVSAGSTNFSLNSIGLQANTTYYIVVDGDNTGVGVTSAAECQFEINISGSGVTRPIPSVQITASANAICKNEVATFYASTNDCPDATEYRWYINDTLAAITSDTIYQTSGLTNGDIVSVETDCYSLCPETITSTNPAISVYSFLVDAGFDQTSPPNQAVTILGSTSAPTYQWTPSSLVSNPTSLNVIIVPTETITLTLTATENGCTLSDQVTITVLSEVDIPNTFSPNDDGNNDKWIISGIENYPDARVKIFTRWGQEVFQSTGYSTEKAWDGTVNGGKVNESVYFYIIELKDSSNTILKGSITVIK